MYHQQFPIILGRSQRAQERLRRALFLRSKPLQLRYAITEKHLSFEEKDQLSYQVAPGTDPEGSFNGEFTWGHSDQLVWRSAWFCAQVDLSGELQEWQTLLTCEEAQIALDLSFSGEGLVFDSSGRIVQGISGGSVLHHDFQHSLVLRADELLQDGKLKIWIEAASNTLFGLEREDNPENGTLHYYGRHEGKVFSAQIILLNTKLWHYLRALESATQLAQGLLQTKAAAVWGAQNSHEGKLSTPRAKRLIYAIDQSLSLSNVGKLSEALSVLRTAFVNGNAPSDLKTVAVGHAHIDTGWLWPVQETVRKCARTFANQLRLMKHYPTYIFGASQAQHYAFVKQHYPEIYSEIRKRIAEGRWEVQGAMWLEADTNIPSGESLVRQILHGKNFFKDEFNVDVRNLWLPDVFGYSANLPQLLRRAGVPYFLTQKLSWSQYNEFPHHTFHWQGVDGSSVLTHFPPEATYNSTLTLGGVHGLGLSAAQNNFREAHFQEEFMTLYGVGDGGGGPDEDMIERGLLLAEGVENAPKVQFGRADEFFERLVQKEQKFPYWQGELYLELHRGTLTSQARTKYGNRRLEQTLRLVEYLYCLNSSPSYPQEELDRLWKILLLNQFHDIIPGSSIREVYLRTEQEHSEALDKCHQLIRNWAADVRENIPNTAGSSANDCLTLINPYSLPMKLLVSLPWNDGAILEQSEHDIAQILASEKGQALVQLEPQAIVRLKAGATCILAPDEEVEAVVQENMYILENNLVRYCFSRTGQLQEAWDKELGRNILSGAGNRLCLYHDWPRDWDAWDIDINYQDELLEELVALNIELLSGGNRLFRELCFTYAIGSEIENLGSTMKQVVRLEAHSKRLLFHNQVDWKERHRMLRVSFEAAVRSEMASYDIQYAYIQRPTHRNTSWEMAKFEVVGQRYADLSDLDYGVSLLNDCKYGYQVLNNCIDLNLLRSPTLPDPDADLGSHEFCYALLPHDGSLAQAMPVVQAEAARLNAEPLQFAGYLNTSIPLRILSENVTLEVLKKAEKSPDMIIRLVERAGRQSRVSLLWENSISQVVECDLIEWNVIGEPLGSGTNGSVQCAEMIFEPFAVRTFLLRL